MLSPAKTDWWVMWPQSLQSRGSGCTESEGTRFLHFAFGAGVEDELDKLDHQSWDFILRSKVKWQARRMKIHSRTFPPSRTQKGKVHLTKFSLHANGHWRVALFFPSKCSCSRISLEKHSPSSGEGKVCPVPWLVALCQCLLIKTGMPLKGLDYFGRVNCRLADPLECQIGCISGIKVYVSAINEFHVSLLEYIWAKGCVTWRSFQIRCRNSWVRMTQKSLSPFSFCRTNFSLTWHIWCSSLLSPRLLFASPPSTDCPNCNVNWNAEIKLMPWAHLQSGWSKTKKNLFLCHMSLESWKYFLL